MKELQCTNCGSNNLEIQNNIARCNYCDTMFVISDVMTKQVTIKNPMFVCPKCGDISDGSYSDKCQFCDTFMQKLNPPVDFDLIYSATKQEEEEFALLLQPKHKFDQKAWEHRIHMKLGLDIKGIPRGFNFKYQENVEHPQCPHCGQYLTRRMKKLFKDEYYWYCCFCEKKF